MHDKETPAADEVQTSSAKSEYDPREDPGPERPEDKMFPAQTPLDDYPEN